MNRQVRIMEGKEDGSTETALALPDAKREREIAGKRVLSELSEYRTATFTDAMLRRSAGWRQREALLHGERSLTYQALDERIQCVRNTLQKRGIRPGTRVAMLAANSDTYVIWYLALLAHGAVVVPLNNRLSVSEIVYILRHAAVSHMVADAEFTPLAAEAGTALDEAPSLIEVSREDPLKSVDPQPYDGSVVDVDEHTIAAIYYTSGTTGKPKGVLHTHLTLIADALQSPMSWEYDIEGCRSLAVTPLFHIASHTIFLPVMFIGGTLAVDNYGTQHTIDLVRKLKINTLFAVPSVLLLMVDKARTQGIVLDGVRVLMFGAAPMTISKLEEVQALFPSASLIHGMGQTESGGTLVTLPGAVAFERAGSVGMGMPCVDVAIFDEHDNPLPPGTVGELVARGPNIMKGYLNDPMATESALRKGWLHTGDLGYISEEGLVTLVDRKKDMIIRGGENIYSCEVEQALLGHPAISGAAVIGVPDRIFGEQVAAYLVVKEDHNPPTKEELRKHCGGMLADYKIPVFFQFLDQLPQTATGKVRKADLRLVVNTNSLESKST